MSESATPPVPEPAPAPVAQPDATDWKAEARKWEQRSKENKTALDALTEQHATATGRIAELESSNTELAGQVAATEAAKERASLVDSIAKDKGVPAEALRGATAEELTAHADTLASLLKPSAPVIDGQAKTPGNSGPDPLREFTRQLFDKD